MNTFQKVLVFAASKALGFPVWRGSTQDIPPGGWRTLDWQGGYSDLHEVPAFVGCSRVLQSVIGSPPFQVFREDASGAREKFTDHPTYPLLYKSPNRYQTSTQLRKFLTLSYCQFGNAYAQIARLGNRVASINPLLASRMVPKFAGGEFFYEYTWPNTGRPQRYEVEDIIHVKHASRDGFMGTPPVPQKLLERALTTAAYGAAFMRNQGRPSGVVESPRPKPKDPDFIEKWREDWRKLFSGENAGATAILWDDSKYKVISSMPNDAQYVETLKQLDADFCGVFGVPLQLISSQDKAPTYASSEQFSLQFIMYTGSPLAEDFEQEFNKKLFPKEPNVFCKMDLDSLLRGDVMSQSEYFLRMITHSVLSPNDVLKKLNMPTYAGGEQHVIQANMVDINKLPDLSASATPGLTQGDIRKSLDAMERKAVLQPIQVNVEVKPQTINLAPEISVHSPANPEPKTFLFPTASKRVGTGKRLSDGSIAFEIEDKPEIKEI